MPLDSRTVAIAVSRSVKLTTRASACVRACARTCVRTPGQVSSLIIGFDEVKHLVWFFFLIQITFVDTYKEEDTVGRLHYISNTMAINQNQSSVYKVN